ncbi:hypothetical protein SDC9_102960 [bioreactor metagenome]|uniref:Polymerase/histidinol phosphatase N-terminal domain-containing protein n=1 Tax=bioreactor metagenome TaxID=1076179 RepID=A0A645ASV9_9ZZZZ|nr:CehA/McbA family metallohydrolase [Oscillospiraceae bacterium]
MYTDKNGRKWFKGNLHMHTTLSDGRKAPEEAARIYREKGYDFISITDHWEFYSGCEADGLTIISGCEFHTFNPQMTHIVGAGMEYMPQLDRNSSVQEIIDAINAAGGAAILAHPAWSLNTPEFIASLNGLAGAEIYNSVSGYPFSARPYSGTTLDLAAKAGCLLPLFASDDTHYYNEELFRGFIYVNAEELTGKSILDAVKAGRFYATQGPVISEEKVFGGKYSVSADAEYIQFYSASFWNADTTARIGRREATAAEFVIKPQDSFVRAEVCDKSGLFAWTSPKKI